MSFSPRRLLAKPPAGAQINWSHQMADGLVGAWLFNEGGGRIVNNLCEQGGNLAAITPIWNSGGVYMNALDGNTFVSPSQRSSLSLTKMTVMCRTRALGGGTARGLIEKCTGVTPFSQYCLYLDGSSNDLFWTVKPASTQVYCIGAGDFGAAADRQWHTFAGTHDAVNLRVYVDGVHRDTDACGPCTTGAGSFTLGGLTAGTTSPHTGWMDVAYVWNRPLSSPDLEWLDEEPYLPVEAPIWRKYFIPPSGPQVSMDSWAGLTATLTDYRRIDVVPYQ